MNCKEARLFFTAYLDGEIKPGERAELEVHLARCPECSSLLKVVESLSQELRNLPDLEPSSELINELYLIPMKAPIGQKAHEERKLFGWKFWLSPAFQPVLTSLTVILTGISLIFFTSPGESFRKTADLELHRTYSLAQKTLVKAGILKDKIDGYRENFIASLEAKNLYKSENNKAED
jgi:hypothetical protein